MSELVQKVCDLVEFPSSLQTEDNIVMAFCQKTKLFQFDFEQVLFHLIISTICFSLSADI
jgi:hypothetical protein